MKNELLHNTLHCFKQRIQADNTMMIQQEEGDVSEVTFSFNEPCTLENIDAFSKQTGWCIPLDFQYFLLQHNGCYLFVHPHYGGGIDILPLGMIATVQKDYGIPQNFYPIAWSHHSGGAICINNDKVKNGDRRYLHWFETMVGHRDELDCINTNFETWFDRLIVAQGSEFWLWPINDLKYK